MKEFIRTKDKIMYSFNYHFIEIGNEKLRKILPNLEKDEIIKQADTIEELCDVFVYSDNVFKNVIYENYNALKMLLKIRKNYIVYGAIWTDKGLIYVAKMNKNGELELL